MPNKHGSLPKLKMNGLVPADGGKQVLHPCQQVAEVALVDQRITDEYDTGIEGLQPQDRKVFRKPITTLFKYPLGDKVLWLELVSFARVRPAQSSTTSRAQHAERRLTR